MLLPDRGELGGEGFLCLLDGGIGFGMQRTRFEEGQLHAVQALLHAGAAVVRPEMPQRSGADVTDAVFDHAIALQVWPGGDQRGQFPFQLTSQKRWTSAAGAVAPAVEPFGIVAPHPVTQGLAIHPGAPGGIRPTTAVQSHGDPQQTP